MNKQNLLIYDSVKLYDIFLELKEELNFNIIFLSKKDFSIEKKKYENYLFLSLKKIEVKNQLVLDKLPIKISRLLEQINVNLLKQRYVEQSEVKIGLYQINLNSRELIFQNQKLKLTEKEIKIILYLSEINKSIKTSELQNKVWGYRSDLETHTVETHIYRLRKKISEKFNINNLIINDHNGYRIKLDKN